MVKYILEDYCAGKHLCVCLLCWGMAREWQSVLRPQTLDPPITAVVQSARLPLALGLGLSQSGSRSQSSMIQVIPFWLKCYRVAMSW